MLTLGRGPLALAAAMMAKATGRKCVLALYREEDVRTTYVSTARDCSTDASAMDSADDTNATDSADDTNATDSADDTNATDSADDTNARYSEDESLSELEIGRAELAEDAGTCHSSVWLVLIV